MTTFDINSLFNFANNGAKKEEETTVEKTTVVPATVDETTVEPTTVEPATVEPATVDETTVKPAAAFSPSDIFSDLSQKAEEADAELAKEMDEEKNKKTAKTTAPAAKKDVWAEINVDTTIRVGADIIDLVRYFLPDEIENGVVVKGKTQKIDAEMVRSRLEKDYPEFVKGHSTLNFFNGKRNFIVAVPMGKTKG